MDKTLLKASLTKALYNVYDSEICTPVIDFLQGEHRVLLYLHMYMNSNVYPSDLSKSLHVTRQRITSILSSLRRKNYITMKMSEKDRRKMRVFLTNDGEKYILEKENTTEKQIDLLVRKLGDDNIRELTRIVELIVQKNDDQL